MKKEVYLTKKQVKNKYGISKAKLWMWKIAGKIKPIYMPSNSMHRPKNKALEFYKESDILKILNN